MIRNWKRHLSELEMTSTHEEKSFVAVHPAYEQAKRAKRDKPPQTMSSIDEQRAACGLRSKPAERRRRELTDAERQAQFVLLFTRLLKEKVKQDDTIERANTIVQFDPTTLNHNSLDAKIEEALVGEDNGMHVLAIIDKLVAGGWRSKSKYHVYSSVYSTLSRNTGIYERVGRATFKLRDGIERKPVEKPVIAPVEPQQSLPIPSTKEVIQQVIEMIDGHIVIDPFNVWQALYCAGSKISYSTVKRTMKKHDLCGSPKRAKDIGQKRARADQSDNEAT